MIDICEADYAAWKERSTMADCASEVGLDEVAKKLIKAPANTGVLSRYLAIIVSTAYKNGNDDVIDRLHYAGLIGQGGLI